MTSPSCSLALDAATATARGARPYQEDAVIADVPIGGELAMAVLADGMGGHAAGDVASKIAVTEVYSDLKLQSGDPARFAAAAPTLLRDAALAANDCIRAHAEAHADTAGMGATLIALAIARDRLYWLSVGDSPLFLFRAGTLSQINEDHSMAPQIDLLVSAGQISAEEARDHPDRNCLTSVLCGTSIARIDCPATALDLRDGDIVIAASDGLQFLADAQIEAIVARHRREPGARIAQALLAAVAALDDPDQDNVTLAVIRVTGAPAAARTPSVPVLAWAGARAVQRPSLLRSAFSFGRAAFQRSGSR